MIIDNVKVHFWKQTLYFDTYSAPKRAVGSKERLYVYSGPHLDTIFLFKCRNFVLLVKWGRCIKGLLLKNCYHNLTVRRALNVVNG